MALTHAERNRTPEERAIEGEGVVFSSLPAWICTCRQCVSESERKELSAAFGGQPLRVYAHRDGLKAKAAKLTIEFRAIATPERIATLEASRLKKPIPEGTEVFEKDVAEDDDLDALCFQFSESR